MIMNYDYDLLLYNAPLKHRVGQKSKTPAASEWIVPKCVVTG